MSSGTPSTGRRRSRVFGFLTAVCLVFSGLIAAATATAAAPGGQTAPAAAPAAADDGWFTSWAQSQQRVSGKTFTNQSMRMITHLSQGGDAARIRLQNQFGTAPVTITQTSLALSAGGPAIVAASNRALTFNGNESVTIPVGGEVWSDPTDIETTAQQDVAVTFYLAGSPVTSLHDLAGRNNYGAPANSGNRNSEASGASFTENLPWTYFVSAVDVYNTDLAGTIVAYGSSVVDGTGSDNCGPGCNAFGQNKRWTDVLARRVVAELPAHQQVAVVNEGIGGTVSSPACGGGGLDGVSRLDRDVLALHGVTGVIFYYGTNDLALNCSATDILASYRTIFGRLRDAGIKIFVTPITPRPGYTSAMNAHRATVNAFVREGGDCSGTCDGVLDFDTVLKDPANANSINPPYDTGDGVHANVAGQKAIADSIPLKLLGTAGVDPDSPLGVMGDLLDAIQDTDDQVGDLADEGDLAAGSRTHIGDALAAASTKVEGALASEVAGDADQVPGQLSDGLATIAALTSWVAESSADGPVKRDLTTRLESMEALFNKAIAGSLGVSVVIAPVVEPKLPGMAVSGTIDIANRGDAAISDIKAVVRADGLSADPVSVSKDGLGAGDSVQIPFTVSVPKRQQPGTYDAAVSATFTSSFGTFTVKGSTPWVSVTSGVDITKVTSAHPADGSAETATLTATLENSGDAPVSGQLTAVLPDGWPKPPPSARVTIEPGESKDVVLPVAVGVETAGGSQPVTMRFVENGVTLASKAGVLTVDLAAPANSDLTGQLDHIDFGKGPSESSHALQASPSSGTNIEAGVDRRYANSGSPGSWFSAEYTVTAGEPFLIRNLETFDGPKTKRYNIYVNNVLVKDFQLKQTATGQSAKAYQVLVDDPAALANNGKVRIKYEFPSNAGGYYDPSIADSWILPAPADTLAPLASATVTSNALPGDNGWFRGDASVAVSAQDNRAGAVTIETGEAAGWQPYVAPVAVTGDGKHELSYRAKDRVGNSTGQRTAMVWIDGTAPGTQLAVTRGSGVDNADKATLKLAAQDALSGVASTMYRVDGGAWQVLGEDDSREVEGFGEHTVEFFSTDVAGNPEPVRSMSVNLADVDGIAAIVAPQVTGWASIGRTLTATTGAWNTKGLSLQYQWLRDGTAIAGATGSSLKLSAADVGRRIQVEVTASKTGLAPVSATSAATAKVAKAASKVSVSSSKSTVKKGKKVKLSIKATSTGTAQIFENGKRVKTVKLSKWGTASYSLKLTKKGLRSIKVVYSGNSTFAPATSATKKIRVK